jgi:transcriptional regulator with XRE-family HTH domain
LAVTNYRYFNGLFKIIDLMFVKIDNKAVSDHFYEHYMPARSGPTLPLPVARALRKLGADIRDARRRRRIPTTTMAARASISRTTLAKIERGDPGVQFGLYATVLFVLGLTDRIGDLVDVRHDKVGLELEEEHLPQRIRLSAPKRAAKSEG